jgi:hypothetical protein
MKEARSWREQREFKRDQGILQGNEVKLTVEPENPVFIEK